MSEEELHSRNLELESFFTIALDLLSISSKDGYFIKVSREWEKVFGYEEHEICSRPFTDFIHPDDVEATLRATQALQGKKEIFHFVNRYRTKQGEYRYLEWNSAPDGEFVYSAARDITDRVNLQQSLEQSLRHEQELNDMKNRFIAMVSHELRTPLSSIMMSTENLRSYRDRMSSEQIDAKLMSVQSQISHLINLLNDVLQTSRLQQGKLNPRKEKVDLIAMCKSVIQDFLIDERLSGRIEFTSDTEERRVAGEPQLLRLVFYNLIANAIKYSQPNPKVMVQVTGDHQQAQLRISDNGIGIPEADHKKLFQPFYRASNTRKIDGNGLGLNIVQEIVHLHQGTIYFESELNKGTTFTVKFPLIN